MDQKANPAYPEFYNGWGFTSWGHGQGFCGT